MNDRSKYPINGVCRFENFAEHAANNTCPRIPIGSLAGVDEWFMRWDVDGAMVYPYIQSHRRGNTKCYGLTCYFRLVNKDSERSSETMKSFKVILKPEFVPVGYRMQLLDILNLEEGWMDEHGTVTVEYGFLCEWIQGKDLIWRFNFFDRLFDCEEQKNMITFSDRSGRSLKAHKKLLNIQPPSESSKTDNYNLLMTRRMSIQAEEMCLQIAHGVQLKEDEVMLFVIMDSAWSLNQTNVMKYCEKQLLMENLKLYAGRVVDFCMADRFGLRSYMTKLIGSFESTEKLVEILQQINIDSLQSETMKKCVRFFFENSNVVYFNEL